MTEGFASLSVDELRGVAVALRGGRLKSPLSQLALAPYLGRGVATAAPILMKLTAEGLSTEHLAYFFDVLASERESRERRETSVELVTTGPESDGFPTRDTRVVVRELFRQAEHSVVVVGYAVYQGLDVFQALVERMEARPELRVRMFLDVQRNHRDTSRPSEVLRLFAHRFRTDEWPGSRLPDVYYDPRSLQLEATKRASLHAKCVVVDEQVAFVSSANFTEAAQARNIEVGVLLRSAALARQLANHFESLADRQLLIRVPGI
ncbi:MAG: DISARM system phospholipase D-like protein DrmC [Acidimicrobiales bacterium]